MGNRGRIEFSGGSTYILRVRTSSKSHATPLGRLTCPILIVPKYMTHHDLWVSLGVNFIGDVRNEQELLCQRWKLPVRLKLADVACKELRNHKQKEIRSLETEHFTVVCLVAWPLNESEASVDLALIDTYRYLLFLCKFLTTSTRTASVINIRKPGNFLLKQGQHEPHFPSKARQRSKQL